MTGTADLNPPLPARRQPLYLALTYSADEAARITQGFIPRDMDDRWAIRLEDGWLYFRRSWTGFCVFAVRLEVTATGVNIREGWANRDPEQYGGSDAAEDRDLIAALIRNLLLARGR